VAGLVQAAEDARAQIILVARGQAHVPDAEVGAERVRGRILAAAFEVESNGLHQLFRELRLFGGAPFAEHEAVVRVVGCALDFGFSTYGHAQFRFVYFIVKIHLFLNKKLSFIFHPIQNIVSRLRSDLVWWRDHWKSRVGKFMQS
jgi:hypothetical protein